MRNASRMAAALRQRYGNGPVTVVVNRVDSHAEIGQRRRREASSARRSRTRSRATTGGALQALNKGRPLALDNHNKLSRVVHRASRDDLAGCEHEERPRRPPAADSTEPVRRRR